MHLVLRLASVFLTTCAVGIFASCSTGDSSSNDKDNDAEPDKSDGGKNKRDARSEGSSDVIIITQDSSDPEKPPEADNPTTCEEAAQYRSYIGCDYWPTVTPNPVSSIFDFALVISNTGKHPAQVQVTGNGMNETRQVQPDTLETLYLPWVPSLKGPDNKCSRAEAITKSMMKPKGAYHLVSSHPVTVYQFSALEYKGQGGPANKDWSQCPEIVECGRTTCFSYSNDASLLLPSTAMTGTYRIASAAGTNGPRTPFIAITATQDATAVQVQSQGRILQGGGLPSIAPGSTTSFSLQAGDVMIMMGDTNAPTDLSGSLVVADKPVQVISGMPCCTMPPDKLACDHIEESVFPAETLGKNYLVTVPAQPRGNGQPTVGHAVRIIGNFDGTTLRFDPPITAPGVTAGTAQINAGNVLDLGIVAKDFRVWSDEHSFIVVTFMVGADLVEPEYQGMEAKGDPSQSFATAIEQYRNEYVFLAPNDYDANFVNITGRQDANVQINGTPVNPSAYVPIGNTGYGVTRYKLPPTGVHHLTSTHPVGIQVHGYGSYTSFQYPGGLNLKAIAPPPVIIK